MMQAASTCSILRAYLEGYGRGCYYILYATASDVQDMAGLAARSFLDTDRIATVTTTYAVSPKNRIRQLDTKARYDRETVARLLGAGLVAQVGFVQEGAPVVVPMIYGVDGDRKSVV